METEKILKIAANALNSKKARNLSAIKVDELTALTQYFLIASATSTTHVRALADEVEDKLKENGLTVHHIEGKTTGWIALDYESVIVHVFTPDQREFYDLDRMWADGEVINLEEILDEEIGD